MVLALQSPRDFLEVFRIAPFDQMCDALRIERQWLRRRWKKRLSRSPSPPSPEPISKARDHVRASNFAIAERTSFIPALQYFNATLWAVIESNPISSNATASSLAARLCAKEARRSVCLFIVAKVIDMYSLNLSRRRNDARQSKFVNKTRRF
jgi:hypothetical protein